MHTYCRLFAHIHPSCADFLHTNSVLCRPLADLVHRDTLSREIEFQSNNPLAAGASLYFSLGRRSRGGRAMAAATGSFALLENYAAEMGHPVGQHGALPTFWANRRQQPSRNRPSGTAALLLQQAAAAARRGGCHALAGRGKLA